MVCGENKAQMKISSRTSEHGLWAHVTDLVDHHLPALLKDQLLLLFRFCQDVLEDVLWEESHVSSMRGSLSKPHCKRTHVHSELEEDALRVVEVDVLLGDVHGYERPVDLQVKGNQNQCLRKQIHLRTARHNTSETLSGIIRETRFRVFCPCYGSQCRFISNVPQH